MASTIQFTVNGQARSVTTDPRRTLLEVLREDLGLTGTKYGCGQGECGACSVLVDGKRAFSCTLPIADVEGKQVQTIEGLASAGGLHPIQQAFLDEEAFQCGYCSPGMVMAAAALLKEHPKPSEQQIRAALDENLCRCCDYPRIIKAVQRAAGAAASAPVAGK